MALSCTRFVADAQSVDWVADAPALASAVAGCGARVGLDSEFIRTRTFFPEPGLYQLADEHGRALLIDPLAIPEDDHWLPFSTLLNDPGVAVVMHACSEDLELLLHHLGVAPAGVFDTQLAHAFVSDSYSLGYQNLVATLLGVDLDKHETRSNWRRRPLSDEQIRYAVEDIRYLLPMHDALTESLSSQGRLLWFEEENGANGG